jgi:hypothetical protein
MTGHSCLFVTMPWHHFACGSHNKAFLLTGDIGNNNDSAKNQEESIISSPYVCIACGFHSLDDPGLQFQLEESHFCFESLTGNEQCVAPLFLSPCSKNKQPSIFQQWRLLELHLSVACFSRKTL